MEAINPGNANWGSGQLGDGFVFTVQSGVAHRAQPISLAASGFHERADLQEWVRNNPEILGDGVRIVTFEINAWQGRDGRASDRLWPE